MSTVTSQLTTRFQQYVDDVLDGRVVVGNLVRLAIERHQRDIETGAERGLMFDEDEGQFAIDFIELLKHSKGEWADKQFILDPWQVFIVASIFGWTKFDKRYRTQRRRFNTAFVSTARKTGKSTLAAGVGHKLFVADGEEGCEVYSAATKRDQAKIVHEEAKRMVRSSPSLQRIVRVYRDNLSIAMTNSKYEPLGADADTTDGLHIHGAIVDEVHAHKTRDLWDVLESGTSRRRNPLMFAITTAGEIGEEETSIYRELKGYSIKVLEGTLDDDSWFSYIATLDESDEWTDESVWIKANPDLERTPDKMLDLHRKCEKAKKTPSAVPNFRRKHMNEDVESSSPWLSMEAWNKCDGGGFYDDEGMTEETISRFGGKPCCVGIDLSQSQDITAAVFAFIDSDGSVDVIPFAWCPRENASGRTKDKRVPYLSWADRGRLHLTEGNTVDYEVIRELLKTSRDKWKWDVRQVFYDPAFAQAFVDQMQRDDGWRESQIAKHFQNCNQMNEPITAVEKLVIDGKLRHGGHEPLRWCVSNVDIYHDSSGRRRFDKRKLREKIDIAVAMTMAVGGAVNLGQTRSRYADRGFLTT